MCYAVTDNIDGAIATLAQARENSDGSIADLITMVSKAIEDAGNDGAENVELRLGVSGNRFSEFRVMPSLPASFMEKDLECVWQAFLEPSKPFKGDAEVVLIGEDAHGSNAADTLNSQYEKPMISRWRDGGWRPTGELLFDEGKVFFKSPTRMTAWNTDHLGSSAPAWKSAWTNSFPLDEATKTLATITKNWGRRSPTSKNDVARWNNLYIGRSPI